MSAPRTEDYAIIGDGRSCALISREGSIDWFCAPRFDSPACFARLVGGEENGFWSLRPRAAQFDSSRRYREDSLILETDHQTATGRVRVTDCMLESSPYPLILRHLIGLEGEVAMQMELAMRFDYGQTVPWVTRTPFSSALRAVAGSNALHLQTNMKLSGRNLRTYGECTVRAGQTVSMVLSWTPSHAPAPGQLDEPEIEIERQALCWQDWIAHCRYKGPHQALVRRSLLTIKALAFSETGGVIAAPTTSLPEKIGGTRNWDYRYCWLRDSTLTLRALLNAGFRQEALAWRDWLMRAVAGTPDQINVVYGLGGERSLPEQELPWLAGYRGSAPVRIGNAASLQFQLDGYGHIINSFQLGRQHGLSYGHATWQMERRIVNFVGENWRRPDRGIWEVRGAERHFTHSKALAWVAMDRAVKAIDEYGFDGNRAAWAGCAREIHDSVCANGFDRELGSFVQSFGAKALDASTLLLAHTGFLPATDPRLVGTADCITERLMHDGLVMRYRTNETDDGLGEQDEGAFLPCTLWLADVRAMQGRRDQAEALFARVASLQNDVGLFAEEYDCSQRCFSGNFPQAFTHVGVINSAYNLLATERTATGS